MIRTELQVDAPRPPGTRLGVRQTQVLRLIGVAPSSWHRVPREGPRKRPGPLPRLLADEVVLAVVEMATTNPWYGYKKIAIMCRRAGHTVKDREAYVVMRDHGLLKKPQPRRAELHQAAKLFELLPQGPNDLWQMDVTYIHIPGYGWWYAVTVIDYYSRYLLACHLTPSYSAAETAYAVKLARQEAERIHGPLTKRPFLVTDNGSSFIARRFVTFVQEQFQHVRIQYRTPQQLGLLERFHQTLKTEEVYWRLYDHPQHCRECLAEFRAIQRAAASLGAGAGRRWGRLVPADVYVLGRTTEIPRWQTWARAAQAKLDKMMEDAA